MLNHPPRDPRHIGRLPRKHVLVCPEESNELEFLFGLRLDPTLTILASSNESTSTTLTPPSVFLSLVPSLASPLAALSNLEVLEVGVCGTVLALGGGLTPLKLRLQIFRGSRYPAEVLDHLQTLLVALDHCALITLDFYDTFRTRYLECLVRVLHRRHELAQH